jgi:hypothetical protein
LQPHAFPHGNELSRKTPENHNRRSSFDEFVQTYDKNIYLTVECFLSILAVIVGRWIMAFERYVPPRTAGARPRATIRPSGLISFDATSVEVFDLDKATHAVLFFDKTRKLLGIHTTSNQKESGAFKLSRRRRSVSLKAPQFFSQYGLTIDEAQRFDVSEDKANKMLTINVKNVQRRRGRRPRKA